jgi:predicted HTH transcriptional regulator
MTDQELAELLTRGEADRVERKQALSDAGDIRQAICAFANDLPDHRGPGVLFIGVRDDGTCANLPITDQLLANLAHMRSDGNILPFPSMVVQKRVLSGCNAILHRSYESTNAPARVTWLNDRIEIVSPGGVYGSVTPESFGRPGVTDYRNLHLAEAMRNLGYVQKFGLGIQLARQALGRNGNPDLVFDIQANYISATLRPRA